MTTVEGRAGNARDVREDQNREKKTESMGAADERE